MSQKLRKAFENRKVLVTGHTGFKGSWLSIWLKELGADVTGYSIDPPTKPNNFELTNLSKKIKDIRGDIRNKDKLHEVVSSDKPEIIFHLAAQPIVLKSFDIPKDTFDINVGGTINILEVARHSPSVKTIVIITSDKCYRDQGAYWGYRETDSLGGHDPYSASKGMAELAIASYRTSFFHPSSEKSLASARAGNVIGGGDFADFRLVPDCVKSLLLSQPIAVRNPNSMRPWQHVLVPLSGYLALAAKLQEEKHSYADAWNFGPLEHIGITAQQVVEKLIELWGSGSWQHVQIENAKKETGTLRLSWEKAAHHLKWAPAYNWEDALISTAEWFKDYKMFLSDPSVDLYNSCVKQIRDYTKKAEEKKIHWALSV